MMSTSEKRKKYSRVRGIGDPRASERQVTIGRSVGAGLSEKVTLSNGSNEASEWSTKGSGEDCFERKGSQGKGPGSGACPKCLQRPRVRGPAWLEQGGWESREEGEEVRMLMHRDL